MFSRYVGPMIRRMAAYVPPSSDPSLDGFTVIVEWLKQHPGGSSDQPIHETIAVFVSDADKTVLKLDNPEATKGHEGHHVNVTGKVTDGVLHIDNLTMANE